MLSIYIVVFLVITACAAITIFFPKYDKGLYYISFGILVLFLCFRFGQGTDYPGYMCIYHYAETALDPQLGFGYYMNHIHTEIGWKMIMVLFQLFNAEFWIITFIVARICVLRDFVINIVQ